LDFFFGTGMFEGKGVGVEHLALGVVLGLGSQPGVLFAAVDAVSHEGETEVLEMDADLVGSAGMQDDLDEGGAMQSLEDSVAGVGASAFAIFHSGHGSAVTRVTRNGDLDFACQSWQFAANNGVINFLHGAVSELIGQTKMGGIIFGNDKAAAGVFIEAMNNPGPGVASDPTQLACAMVEQSIDEGMFVVACARMHHEARGFVNDDQIRIFMKDVEGNFFGGDFEFFRFGKMNGYEVAGAGRVGGFVFISVYEDVAGIDQLLQSAAGDRGESSTEVNIQAFAGKGTFNRDGGVPVPHAELGGFGLHFPGGLLLPPKKQSGCHDDDAHCLAWCGDAAQVKLRVIAAKHFGESPYERIENEVEGEDLPIKFPTAVGPGKKGIKREIQCGLVELDRMHSHPMSPMVGGKMNGPGQTCFNAITTAGHKATDSTKGVAQGDARGHDIGDTPEGEFIFAAVNNCAERRADEPAVEDQPCPHIKKMRQRFVGKILLPIGNDVEDSRTQNGPENNPGGKIDHAFTGQVNQGSAAASGPKSGNKPGGSQDAIPINLKPKNIECDTVHFPKPTGKLSELPEGNQEEVVVSREESLGTAM
jgi:hypothetical protein